MRNGKKIWLAHLWLIKAVTNDSMKCNSAEMYFDSVYNSLNNCAALQKTKQFPWQTQQYYFNPALSDDFSVYVLLQVTVHRTLGCSCIA